MAGGGGGAWKVAYADFVTAMMAFFMVMWLVSQDQKVKDSVAKYFVDPVGFSLSGSADRPKDSAGLFESEYNGAVPGAKKRTSGRGRGTMRNRENQDSETTMVADSIMEEPSRAIRNDLRNGSRQGAARSQNAAAGHFRSDEIDGGRLPGSGFIIAQSRRLRRTGRGSHSLQHGKELTGKPAFTNNAKLRPHHSGGSNAAHF